MKVHKRALLCLCIFFNKPAASQFYYYNNQYYDKDFLFEAGISLGAINCLTDIGGHSGNGGSFLKDLNWQHTRFSGSIFLGGEYRDVLGARLEFSFGEITAYDSILKNDQSVARNRYLRNLHFKSGIRECLLLLELYPFRLLSATQSTSRFSPYLTGGIGIYHFNPRAQTGEGWIGLRDLRLEGQGFEEYPDRKMYALTQLNVPVGTGIKIECSALINLRIEILHRVLFTDYLDDVSTRYIDPSLFQKYLPTHLVAYAEQLYYRQKEIEPAANAIPDNIRGNNNRNDSYFTIQLKLGFVMGREKR